MSDIRARRDAVLKSSISIKAIGNSVTNFTKGLFKARTTASEIAQQTNESNKFNTTDDIVSLTDSTGGTVSSTLLDAAGGTYPTDEEFVNADYHIIGCLHDASAKLINLYKTFSMCEALHYIVVTPQEASFIKYACNSFLATKVSFFNQLYDLCQENNCSYNAVMKGVTLDKRIGSSHTKVPGYDLKRGFGGACLPKDTLAFLRFSQDNMSILKTVLDINNDIRKQYKLDEREKVNKINFTNH